MTWMSGKTATFVQKQNIGTFKNVRTDYVIFFYNTVKLRDLLQTWIVCLIFPGDGR